MTGKAQRKYLRAYNRGVDHGKRQGSYWSFVTGAVCAVLIMGFTLRWIAPTNERSDTLSLQPGESVIFRIPLTQEEEQYDQDSQLEPQPKPLLNMKQLIREGWL